MQPRAKALPTVLRTAGLVLRQEIFAFRQTPRQRCFRTAASEEREHPPEPSESNRRSRKMLVSNQTS